MRDGDYDLVPSIVLDRNLVGEKHLFDAWREAVREFYDVHPLLERERSASVNAWLIDSFIFSKVSFSSQFFSHNAVHLKNNCNFLSLQIYRSGESRGIVDGESFKMLPGEVHIFDFSREFHSFCKTSVVAGVIIPHNAIGYDPGQHPAHFLFPDGSAVTQLLIHSIISVLDNAPNLSINDANSLSKGFCGLLQGLLCLSKSEMSEELKTGDVRREAMRSYLDKHLTDPDLNIEKLSKEFSVSIPTIYRQFADTGGVARYITKRRLDRAYSQLASTPLKHGKVQNIANSLGFDDPAYFSRLFRRRFGFPPSFAANMNEMDNIQNSSKKGRETPYLGDWFKSIAS